MLALIIIGVLVVLLIIWAVSVQRSLSVLDENINNAKSQISVQLSSRWDALTALLDLTKGYAKHEADTLENIVKQRRSVTLTSSADDIQSQENIITDALGKITAIAENYPDLKASENYMQTMNSVNSYENSVRQSRLIYNDCVTKFNRSIRMFPRSLIAGMMGFSAREYLKEDASKADMPSMK